MDTGTLYDAVVRLVNQRAGTTRTPEYGRAVLSEMTKGEPNRKKFYAALIEFLEEGEPAKKTRAYERLSTKFQKQLEIQDMAIKKDTAKKTAAKKTSGFGNDKPVAPKGAVDRPKVPAKTEKKPFVPTTPKELEEMEKRNKTKAEESKAAKATAKEGGKKSATAEKSESAGGRRSRVNGDAKITVLVKENPKREGSGAHERFALYKTGMTVAKALEAGVTAADIAYDSKHEYIKLG